MTTYIYVISHSETGPCKIGVSKEPERRLKQLQTGHSETLTVFHREPIEDAHAILMERIIHKENKHRRRVGEWFDLSVPDAIAELRHALIRHADVVEREARNRAFRRLDQ